MSQVVTFYCETHKVDVETVSEFDGFDEDGRAQYEILHGVETKDDKHINGSLSPHNCDLSLEVMR